MANKQKKKRNKPYRGKNATVERPVITRVSAVNRSKLGQWWFDHKRVAKPVMIITGILIILVLVIIEIIQIATS